MRMLLILLILLNAGLAGYYLTGEGQGLPKRPAPSAGTLELVSEITRARPAQPEPGGDAAATTCWRSPPIARGEPLQSTLARIERAGYSRLRVEPVSSGYAVIVARVNTIQEAAAELSRLMAAGVPEPRVRPGSEGDILLVSGRFETVGAAREHAGTLREKGVDAGVLSPESGGDAVRVYVRGAGAPPDTGWEAVNCQPEQR